MDRSNNGRRPAFFWQGSMILLPVVVLAVVGLVSLRQDEQTAEQTARKRAGENAQSLARAMAATVRERLEAFDGLQKLYMHRLGYVTIPLPASGNASSMGLAARVDWTNFPTLLSAMAQWDKAYPSIRLDDAIVPMGTFWDDGRSYLPRDFLPVPLPAKWFLEFSPTQRQAWQTLRQAQSRAGSTNDLPGVWQEFLATKPSEQARHAASNYEQLASAEWRSDRGDASDFTETGVPFNALWCYQELAHATNRPCSPRLLDAIWNSVTSYPTYLTPLLLAMAEKNPPDDPTGRTQLRCLQESWDRQSAARQWLEPFHQHPEFFTGNRWITTDAGEALALTTNGTIFIGDQTGRRVETCHNVTVIVRPVLEAIFAGALAENQFLVPDYILPVVTLEGKPLGPPGHASPPDEKSLLADAAQSIKLVAGQDPVTFHLAFYLASRDKMLASEQRRAHLFGALIAAAVLAAVAGCLTARRAFHQQHRLSEMKTNFVSSVSHELRAPIASMRLLAEGLERGKITDPVKQKEYHGFLVQESRRLTSLIENVLDFSRIEQGRKQYQFEPTDLSHLTEQTIKLMLPYAAERKVELVYPSVAPGLQACCDGMAIQQALINLIDNAIKHSPAGAKVIIGLESAAPATGLRLWVEDSGPGIPAEEHGKIFERFYRRGSELRRETQGIGIGLTIVKHIVEAHRGRVLVRSAVGEGSRFTIELPAEARI